MIREFTFGIMIASAICMSAAVPHAAEIVEKYRSVWTSPPSKIPSGDCIDAPFLANGDMALAAGGNPAATRLYFAKSDFWKFRSREEGGVGPQVIGGIDINASTLSGGTYSATVSYYVPEMNLRYVKGTSSINIRAWMADDANLCVLELTGIGSAATSVVLNYWIASGNGARDSTGKDSGIAWIKRDFVPASSGVDFASGAAWASKKFGVTSDTFTLQATQKVTILAVMKSNFETTTCKAAAIGRVRAIALADLAASYQKHQTWWQNYWKLSSVSIGDSVLEKHYYGGLYALGSGSRNPDFPPGLFGHWATTNFPGWQGDFHLNYNYQAPFYGLYAANRLQTAGSYEAPILDFIPRGKFYADSILKIRGIWYPVGIGPKGLETSRYSGYCNPQGLPGNFAGQKSNANYCAVNMVQRFYATYDTAYMRKVYPFFIELANFWEDYLKFENGRYVIYDDASHECTYGDFNSVVELAFVKMVFRTILDMSAERNVDATRRAKWLDIVAKISAFPTQVMSGKTVFRFTETGTSWWDGNTVGIQHVYPAGAIGLGSDSTLLAIARSTLQVMNRFIDGNGMNSFFPAVVRTAAFPPDTVLARLRTLAARCFPNLVPDFQPHGMENYSIFHNTINEMLMQSHQGVVRLFPVWPKNRDAQFTDLRAYGAFLVSSSLKTGAVQFVSMKSERGRNAVVLNPWKGSGAALYRNGALDSTYHADTLRFKTSVNEVVTLLKEGTVGVRGTNNVNDLKPVTVFLRGRGFVINNTNSGPVSLRILDARGRLFQSVKSGNSRRITLSKENPGQGLYFLEVNNGSRRMVQKVVLY